MVAFFDTVACISDFIVQVLNLDFLGFGSLWSFILGLLLLSLVGFVLSALWKGDGEK